LCCLAITFVVPSFAYLIFFPTQFPPGKLAPESCRKCLAFRDYSLGFE
jgi:hypothetical protein